MVKVEVKQIEFVGTDEISYRERKEYIFPYGSVIHILPPSSQVGMRVVADRNGLVAAHALDNKNEPFFQGGHRVWEVMARTMVYHCDKRGRKIFSPLEQGTCFTAYSKCARPVKVNIKTPSD